MDMDIFCRHLGLGNVMGLNLFLTLNDKSINNTNNAALPFYL